MRISPVICLALSCAVAGFARAGGAEDGGARAQVQVATRNAVNNLLDEVSSTRLTRTVSVGEFARRTGSTDELIKVLQRAQQIGGPRWIDDNTCQIELQISGPIVAQALKRAAAANPKQSPLPLSELNRIAKDWDDRSFSATGAATSRLPALNRNARRPGPGVGGMGLRLDPWWNVGDAAREQVVQAAKADAARRSLSSVRPIVLTPRSNVGDVLAVKGVGEGMQEWFVSQPAAHVELREDLEAEVELAVGPAETFKTFRSLASKQKDVPVPADDGGWLKVRDEFVDRMATPVGRAIVAGKAAGGGAAAAALVGAGKPLNLPREAPAWARRRVEVTGKGDGATKLESARLAEANAEAKIRTIVDDLQLTDKTTVGRAAKDDARVGQAVDRAMRNVRRGRAEYHADGSADVPVYLELGELWDELKAGE
jgi:hypothetical protein